MISMTTLVFMLILLFRVKDSLYLNGLLELTNEIFIIIRITPLILSLLISIKFYYFDTSRKKNYKILFFLVFLAINISFLSLDALIFLIIIELCVLPIIILILNFSKDKDKMESITFMFIINIAGSIPFIIFVSITLGLSFENETQELSINMTRS